MNFLLQSDHNKKSDYSTKEKEINSKNTGSTMVVNAPKIFSEHLFESNSSRGMSKVSKVNSQKEIVRAMSIEDEIHNKPDRSEMSLT